MTIEEDQTTLDMTDLFDARRCIIKVIAWTKQTIPLDIGKGLLDEIIRIGALDFIYNEEDDHQYEEEESNNDAPILLSDEEE